MLDVLVGADDVDACLVTLDAGSAGGPIDVLLPLIDGRDLAPTLIEATRAFDGVPVREGAALDPAVPSCFVGDFVGDYSILMVSITETTGNRDMQPKHMSHKSSRILRTRALAILEGRGTGLGLGAFRLLRFESDTELGRPELAGPTLCLEPLRTGGAAALGWGGGAACNIVKAAGLTNMPLPISQSKYLVP